MARRTNDIDERLMREALELARGGLEFVSPNPMVGAVVARRGRVLARGFHRRYGKDHAEIDALRQVANARGADLYVTLEPCAHHGKTPPCAEAIIRAGIRRVVYAVGDPNPLTRGKGSRNLRKAGLEVESGLLRHEAAALNRPFFHWVHTGRPWVVLKWAMSLDGKIATVDRESRWISGKEARAYAHALRRRVDAVLVGTETARLDDPLLTPRPARGRRPWRVILDRRGRLPLSLRLFQPEASRGGERLYVTSSRVSVKRVRELERRGVRVLVMRERRGPTARGPTATSGLDIESLLAELGSLGISQLLVEGGGRLAGSCVEKGLVDEVACFLAPRILGGATAPTPVGGRGLAPLGASLSLDVQAVRALGKDLLIEAVVR